MQWSYGKNTVTEQHIHEMEEYFRCKLPEEYRYTLILYHGARPSRKVFHTETVHGRMIKSFLTISREYPGNVYDVCDWLKDKLPRNLIPFASDPFGNYLCFDKDHSMRIVFWNHELGKVEAVCGDFDEFVRNLL